MLKTGLLTLSFLRKTLGVCMDKIMSTRLDEAVIKRIGMLAKILDTTKKAVIERAVEHFAKEIEAEEHIDLLVQTWGSWQREESPAETVQHIKEKMRRSQERYKR